MTETFKIAVVTIIVFTACCHSYGQHSTTVANSTIPAARTAPGTLTVTLTVAPSVAVVTGRDGQKTVVVANASGAADNVSVRLTDDKASNTVVSQRDGKASRKTRKK